MTTPCVINLNEVKNQAVHTATIRASAVRKSHLSAQKTLCDLRRDAKNFTPKDLLSPEFFEGHLAPITLNAIAAVTRNIVDDIATLKARISNYKEAHLNAKDWMRAANNLSIENITIEGADLAQDENDYFIRIPAPQINNNGITLPEGEIAIKLHIRPLNDTPGMVRITGSAEFQIARHLRDTYKHHIIPLYREMHNMNVVGNYPTSAMRTKTIELLEKLQDTTTQYLRLDMLFSKEILLGLAGAGDIGQLQDQKPTIMFELKRPANFHGGGRLVALRPTCPTPEIDPETGRAYSPLNHNLQWAVIPHGHRIPRTINDITAHAHIAGLAQLEVAGAQRAFDTYVKPYGAETVTRGIMRTYGSVTDEMLNWLMAQYPQVAAADDGEAEPAPTIG